MARPNAQLIQKNDIVGQFIRYITINFKNRNLIYSEKILICVPVYVRLGIKTIINLQTAGEHSHCGPPLTSSGFSYLPENFMEKDSLTF